MVASKKKTETVHKTELQDRWMNKGTEGNGGWTHLWREKSEIKLDFWIYEVISFTI